jgi:large subunit ribosomal protein L4e
MSGSDQRKAKVLDLEGKEVESVDLPQLFSVPVREDIIARAYVALDSHTKQRQGRDPLAGERTSAETHNPPTGQGISRIPRVKGERYSKSGMAGGVASIVSGRLPFPPRSEKVIRKEINKKERRLALASAIAATADKDLVTRRNHVFTADLPIVVSDDLEKVSRVKDLKKFLDAIGSSGDLRRGASKERKRHVGLSGYKRGSRGPLFVVADASTVGPALKSLTGVSVVRALSLSVLDLAPGATAGRLTIWTKAALAALPKPLIEVGAMHAS